MKNGVEYFLNLTCEGKRLPFLPEEIRKLIRDWTSPFIHCVKCGKLYLSLNIYPHDVNIVLNCSKETCVYTCSELGNNRGCTLTIC